MFGSSFLHIKAFNPNEFVALCKYFNLNLLAGAKTPFWPSFKDAFLFQDVFFEIKEAPKELKEQRRRRRQRRLKKQMGIEDDGLIFI